MVAPVPPIRLDQVGREDLAGVEGDHGDLLLVDDGASTCAGLSPCPDSPVADQLSPMSWTLTLSGAPPRRGSCLPDCDDRGELPTVGGRREARGPSEEPAEEGWILVPHLKAHVVDGAGPGLEA